MEKKLLSIYKTILALSLSFFVVPVFGQQYLYDFGTSTASANGANANNGGAGLTNFFPSTPNGGGTFRVKVGTGGGGLNLNNPGSSLGSSTEAELIASNNGEVNKFGVYDWDAPTETLYLKTKIRSSSTSAGTITIAVGNSSVGSSNDLSLANSLVFLRINYRNDGTISLTRSQHTGMVGIGMGVNNPTMSPDTDQTLEIFANSGTAEKSYTKNGSVYILKPKTWDLWLDNQKFLLVVNYPAAQGSTMSGNISGFSISATNSAGNSTKVILDDLLYVTDFPPYNTTTWNGTEWSFGTPTESLNTVIAGNYDTGVNGKFSTNKLTVNNGNNLNIAANTSITILTDIINNGNITVQSEGNLVQTGNFTNVGGSTTSGNVGKITLFRDSRMKRLDYTYWGSPVANQNLFGFSPNTVQTRFYKYLESNNGYSNAGITSASVFEPAIGYIIRAPNNFPATFSPTDPNNLFIGKFSGVPNSGSISVTLNKQFEGYNLVSNPYPSTINLANLKIFNSSMESTVYFWTNVNDYAADPVNYAANNYATYNIATNTGTTSLNGTKVPNRYVKPGQGFIVVAASHGSTLTFTNKTRTSINTGVFFNMGHKGYEDVVNNENEEIQIDRYWLRLTTPQNNFNETAVVYTEGATNGKDKDFDSPIFSLSSDSFYTIVEDKKIAVQGRQYPLNTTDVVPLGMSAYQKGIYTISLSNKEGVFANGQNIYLHDKLTGTFTNLNAGNYTFSLDGGSNDNRFEVTYEQKTILGTANLLKQEVSVYRNGSLFEVKSLVNIKEVQVFDITGKLFSMFKPNSQNFSFTADDLIRGVYVLKITTVDGKVFTKKILK